MHRCADAQMDGWHRGGWLQSAWPFWRQLGRREKDGSPTLPYSSTRESISSLYTFTNACGRRSSVSGGPSERQCHACPPSSPHRMRCHAQSGVAPRADDDRGQAVSWQPASQEHHGTYRAAEYLRICTCIERRRRGRTGAEGWAGLGSANLRICESAPWPAADAAAAAAAAAAAPSDGLSLAPAL